MTRVLTDSDEYLHAPGDEPNWSENRYVDFVDPRSGLAGWFRLGNRVNEGRAEVSLCLYLPDGSAAVGFTRPAIRANDWRAGGLHIGVARPYESWTVSFTGALQRLSNPLDLAAPDRALRDAPAVHADVALTTAGDGIDSVLGRDAGQVASIFLPGQTQHHYQHLVRVTGRVTIGASQWQINGPGAQDHSWGPRNWHAKQWFRWLIGATEDGFGFMLTRSAGVTGERRGGFVWESGRYLEVTDLRLRSQYGTDCNYAHSVDVDVRAGERGWQLTGEYMTCLPLRHRHEHEVLRIVKSPVRWTIDGARTAWGSAEYHDVMRAGEPAGRPE